MSKQQLPIHQFTLVFPRGIIALFEVYGAACYEQARAVAEQAFWSQYTVMDGDQANGQEKYYYHWSVPAFDAPNEGALPSDLIASIRSALVIMEEANQSIGTSANPEEEAEHCKNILNAINSLENALRAIKQAIDQSGKDYFDHIHTLKAYLSLLSCADLVVESQSSLCNYSKNRKVCSIVESELTHLVHYGRNLSTMLEVYHRVPHVLSEARRAYER